MQYTCQTVARYRNTTAGRGISVLTTGGGGLSPEAGGGGGGGGGGWVGSEIQETVG